MSPRGALPRSGRRGAGTGTGIPAALVAALAAALALALAVASARPLAAQAADSGSAGQPAAAAQAPDTAAGPVAVPAPTPKAVRYYRTGNVLWVVDNLWALIVPLLLLFTGFSARMRDAAARLARGRRFPTIALFGAMFVLLVFLLDLPLAWYIGFGRAHAYGLSTETAGHWVGNTLKSLALSVLATAALLWIPYLLLRRSPRRWWLWGGLLAVPFLLLVNLIAPIWIAPLFNRFQPMGPGPLRTSILDLAARAGIQHSRVYVVDMSVETNAVNAYVAGVGGTARIVFWDTILKKLTPRQLRAVLGHEMGHYVLGHIWQGILFMSAFLMLSLWLTWLSAGWAIARWKRRFGFDRLADPASLPLLVLLLGVISLVLAPIPIAWTRHQEHEADRFALELTHDNHALASAFVRLQATNLAVPDPGWLYTLWRGSHPSIAARVRFANSYHPWTEGRTGKYAHLFTATPPPSPRSGEAP